MIEHMTCFRLLTVIMLFRWSPCARHGASAGVYGLLQAADRDTWCSDGRPVPGMAPVVEHMTCSLQRGQRCLLIGANGAGKTTLLKTLGGKHMVPQDAIHILGRPPFHDTALDASGELSYLGGNWERDIAFAGNSIPLQVHSQADRVTSSPAPACQAWHVIRPPQQYQRRLGMACQA